MHSVGKSHRCRRGWSWQWPTQVVRGEFVQRGNVTQRVRICRTSSRTRGGTHLKSPANGRDSMSPYYLGLRWTRSQCLWSWPSALTLDGRHAVGSEREPRGKVSYTLAREQVISPVNIRFVDRRDKRFRKVPQTKCDSSAIV